MSPCLFSVQAARAYTCNYPGNVFFICLSQAMVPIGMMYGAHVNVGDFIVKNLLPAIAGNIVGGGFLIGGKPCRAWFVLENMSMLTSSFPALLY
jgi:formate/nitrite transporter FocA (FNT family)